jgi:peptidoglycan-N-acetylglucosamine deacetylase
MGLSRACAHVIAAAASVLLPSLASAQPAPYPSLEDDGALSSAEEQMPPVADHAKPKPKRPKPRAAAPAGQPSPQAAAAQAPCSERNDVLGTSRTIKISAASGLQVGLKTYRQTLKLEDHEVVLTFDDGPLPETTNKVLDALQAECVQATFFLIGQNAAANPQVVRREIREGHTVAHHTWSHPSITMRGLSDEAARADIMKGIAADERAAYGKDAVPDKPHVPFFRFPGFADTTQLLSWLGAQNIAVFGADLWASDWLDMTPEAELTLIMSRLDEAKRGIVLFHDTRPSTAAMMPAFLRELKARNYRVVHIVPGTESPELEQAPANWTSETEATVNRVLSKLLARPTLAKTGQKKPAVTAEPSADPSAE